tara:strand:- start:728 stop:871 length:144 start_codon:yes stop_codon:yes gene_type:complete
MDTSTDGEIARDNVYVTSIRAIDSYNNYTDYQIRVTVNKFKANLKYK